MRPSARDAGAMLAVVAAALLVGELAIFRRADLTRPGSFLFSDAAYSLFVTSEVFGGARLYRDVAYQYGWLPVALHSAVAAVFGNTPTVYLQFLLAVSTAGLLLAYALFRRVVGPGLAIAATIIGLLPVFLVPGALLGGYTSSYYMPLERALLILGALIWRPPIGRTPARGAALGAVVAALQATRFGPGVVLLAVLVGVDLIILGTAPPTSTRDRIRSVLPVLVVAAGAQFIFALAAFALLPRPIAQDLLWPAYFQQAFAHMTRWPALSNWRLNVAQYANPACGIVLTFAGVWMWSRRRQAEGDVVWCLLLLPLLFAAGLFTFLRTDHHLRQFAWVFVPGSVAALKQSRWSRAVAMAGWLPVAAVVAMSVVRGPDPARTIMALPAGWSISVSPAERARIEGIHGALSSIDARGRRGPVMFDPNGAGFYVVYGVPHASRQTWFYPEAVRPHEIGRLLEQYRALTALVVCGVTEGSAAHESPPILNAAFPDALRPSLTARVREVVWSDDQCRVFRLASAR